MAYGTIKVDTITFTDGGIDKSVAISGLVQNPTFTGNVTVTGTVSGNTVQGQTISGVTVTGTTANFTSGNFTNISGGTHTITSGVFALGTAANPSISFTSDPNTGIYSPGADQVAISTNGTGRLFVDASGRVGIGTSNQNFPLSIQTDSSAQSISLFGRAADDISEIKFLENDRTTVLGELQYRQDQLNFRHRVGYMSFSTGGVSERMRLTSDGKLGLGTSSPGDPLVVKADGADAFIITTLNSSNNRTFGVYNSGSENGILYVNDTSGTNIVRLSSAGTSFFNGGSVGIGTTSPSQALQVVGTIKAQVSNDASNRTGVSLFGTSTTEATVQYTGSDGSTYGRIRALESGGSTSLVFDTRNSSGNNAERFRVDSSGRLLVGTSTARTNFYNTTYSSQFQVEGDSSAVAQISATSTFNGANGPILILAKHRGGSPGGNTIVQSGDELGQIGFLGSDGSEQVTGASIVCQVDGTPGANDMPGRLVFSTTADAASSPTERMRIDSSGRLGLGTSSPAEAMDLGGAVGDTKKIRFTMGGNVASIGSVGSGAANGLGNLTFFTRNGSSEVAAMTIDGSQRVGIGTTPQEVLDVNGRGRFQGSASSASSGAGLELAYVSGSTTGQLLTYNRSTSAYLGTNIIGNPLTFSIGTTEAARIDSSGRLGLGTSSPAAPLVISNGGAEGWELGYTSGTTELVGYNRSTSARTPMKVIGQTFLVQTGNPSLSNGLYQDSSGRVGIGTTSPALKLHAEDSSSQIVRWTRTGFGAGSLDVDGSGNAVLNAHTTSTGIAFHLQASEKARIDSSGRLLIGTSSARTNFDSAFGGYAAISQIETAIAGPTGLSIYNNNASGYFPKLVLGISAGSSVGSNDLVANTNTLGIFSFQGSDGSKPVEAATIKAVVDGTPGADDMPGRLVFSTTADGASSPTERARFINSGAFKATNTNDYRGSTANYHELRSNADGSNTLVVTHTGSNGSQYGILIETANDQNDTTRYFFEARGGATTRATIRSNGGLANYSANNVNLSDRNAKKDIAPATGTWNCLKEWEIVNFRYKDQPDDADLNMGVIAQQVAESCPEVITVFQEATEEEPEKLGVKDQQMMWMAIKALQEAQLRIETLEAEVAALKGV